MDRQIDRWKDRQIDRWTVRLADKWANSQTYEQAQKQVGR